MDAENDSQSKNFDGLAQQGRVEFRMLTDGQQVTDDQRAALFADFEDWRVTEGAGRPLTIKAASQRIGVSASVLTEVLKGKYKGDVDAVLRLMDQRIAEDRRRSSRPEVREFTRIRLTSEIFGAVNTSIELNSMAAVIADSGTCKTAHAWAFAQQRPQTFVLAIEDQPADATKVSDLLCWALTTHRGHRELSQYRDQPHRRRLRAIQEFLAARRNAVLLVDEAQKLSRGGLELLRDLHDRSDPTGKRNMPIIFFGDRTFKRLIGETKEGRPTKMTSQLASRMYPIWDVSEWVETDGEGQYYSVEDVLRIIKNHRLKLVTDRAVGWLTKLANIYVDEGHLRLMFMVLRGAILFYRAEVNTGKRLDIAHLQEAFKLACGQRRAELIDQAAGGELLTRAG